MGTSAKSCGPKHSEHPECTGRQVEVKPEITRAENPECSGKQLGGKWETSAISCGPKHQTPNHAALACTAFKGVRITHRQTCLGKINFTYCLTESE